ncbi:MAG: hypothetical protein OSB67_09790, partial [Alphaproteobacteria bacterium]|nr:hypothetical protein [Alphaproteobacteria bacterium]
PSSLNGVGATGQIPVYFAIFVTSYPSIFGGFSACSVQYYQNRCLIEKPIFFVVCRLTGYPAGTFNVFLQSGRIEPCLRHFSSMLR